MVENLFEPVMPYQRRRYSKWKHYSNGNAFVFINSENGTKVRFAQDEIIPAFPETIDLTISRRCTNGCEWCYAGCTPEGIEADLEDPRNMLSLHPYTELALNINAPVRTEALEAYLSEYSMQDVFVNASIHMDNLIKSIDEISTWMRMKILHGIGISYDSDSMKDVMENTRLRSFISRPNSVVHMVAGIIGEDDIKALQKLEPKILILGFKDVQRGKSYKEQNPEVCKKIKWMKSALPDILGMFPVVAFDNLALEQLDIKNVVSPNIWEHCYMGDEGSSSMAIDLTTRKFAPYSYAPEEDWLEMGDLQVDEMFSRIQETSKPIGNFIPVSFDAS